MRIFLLFALLAMMFFTSTSQYITIDSDAMEASTVIAVIYAPTGLFVMQTSPDVVAPQEHLIATIILPVAVALVCILLS